MQQSRSKSMVGPSPEPAPEVPSGSLVGPSESAPSSFEYRSRLAIAGLPLLHVVRGIDPSSGRRPPAVGVIAVGQVAVGLVAIGQIAFGAISVGQASIGLGWGIGQLAFGLLAAGQVAGGALGAVGQIAAGPHALGMVRGGGGWVALGWLAGGLWLAAHFYGRRRRLAPLLDRRAPTPIAALGEGPAHIAAEIVSPDRLRAPLSSRACVFWHAVHVGPAFRAHERSGGEVVIADGSGTARLDLSGEVIFLRSDNYREIAGPDWALHLETSLARGDRLHVAGAVGWVPDSDAGGAFRGGGVTPLFYGRPGQPLVVTTESPTAMRAALSFAISLAWALIVGGALVAVEWAMG